MKVFIIAEAGVNHNGSLKTAKKMIDAAVSAGADAIKFQTFKAEALVSKTAKKAGYQLKTTNKKESQLEMLKKLELDENAHKELFAYCKKKKIMFLSSPFDLKSIDLLEKLGLRIFKIPSGEITNLPYLRKIGSLRKKVIISTGMANMQEISEALNILIRGGTAKKNITVLHCNTEYPTPFDEVNLRAMLTIGNKFKVNVGYSDHTLGIEVPIAAAALGATVIEKHFTLSRNLKGPDHKISLEPSDLRTMVKAIRNIEKALGRKNKYPSVSELANQQLARKSIVTTRGIKKGEIFKEENITVKRPAIGISPMKWDAVVGKIAERDFNEGEMVEI